MTGAVLAGGIAMALMQETAPVRRGLLEVTESQSGTGRREKIDF
jgi:hypothetical protein